MSIFEGYLSVCLALSIVAGITLGQFFPNLFRLVGGVELADINLPVAEVISIEGTTICCLPVNRALSRSSARLTSFWTATRTEKPRVGGSIDPD